MKKLKSLLALLKASRKDVLIVIGLLIVKLIAHGLNLSEFPYYESDEATYTIRALSFLEDGSFDKYTYWYDHAPAGWMLMSVWFFLTSWMGIFGNLLFSGRIFIFILTSLTTVLLYLLAKNVLKNRAFATAAVLIFIISPLSIYFQRRVLLDNIMTFWIVLSIYILSKPELNMKGIVGSSFAYAMATLTKLNAAIFLPALLFRVVQQSSKKTLKMKVMMWLGTAGSLLVLFPLYALLKGELWPVNTDPTSGDFDKGISLFDSLAYQSSRGQELGLPFWSDGSSFMAAFDEWLDKDPIVVMLSFVSLLTLPLLIKKAHRKEFGPLLTVSLSLLGLVMFYARGGVVLEFYIIPLFALASVAGLAFFQLPLRLNLIKNEFLKGVYTVTVLGLLVVPYIYGATQNNGFTRNDNVNLLAAVDWLEENVPSDSVIAADSYALIFLEEEEGFTNVDYNWKVEYDPDVRDKIANDWKNIDYVLVTHEVLKQMRLGATPSIREAFDHSYPVAEFKFEKDSFVDIPNYISTDGDWAQIRKVKTDNDIISQGNWEFLLDDKFKDYGRIIDNQTDQVTTSIQQTNALIQALHEDERARFDGIWSWTKDHMQNRSGDNLLSSEWSPLEAGVTENEDDFGISDSNANTLGDIQAAFALIRAGEVWGTDRYEAAADDLIESIWENSVISRGGTLYLLPSGSAFNTVDVPINPSYYALPYIEEIARYDTTRNWGTLYSDGLGLLEDIQSPVTGHFPNWVILDENNQIVSGRAFAGAYADESSYEAFRIMHWLSMSQSPRSTALLRVYGEYVDNYYRANDFIPASISQSGEELVEFDDTIIYATAYLALAEYRSTFAEEVLQDRVASQFIEETGEWGSAENANSNNDLWLPLFVHEREEILISTPIE